LLPLTKVKFLNLSFKFSFSKNKKLGLFDVYA
jgi:hypothetical protein